MRRTACCCCLVNATARCLLLRAACVRESPMRERAALLTPFPPHAPSPPWQALPFFSSSAEVAAARRCHPSTSSSRHIKLKSNSNQTQIKAFEQLHSTPWPRSHPLKPENLLQPAAGGGSLLRAQPLQSPTPERHAACVCESSMRQRSFLLAPFSPHTPFHALAGTAVHLGSRPTSSRQTLSETQRQNR